MPSQHSIGRMDDTETIQLPSMRTATEHNTCEVRRIAPMQLMEAGIYDDMDSLTGLVGAEIRALAGEGPAMDQAEAMRFVSGNMAQIKKGIATLDKIIEMALVDPPVQRPVLRDDTGQPVLRDGHEMALLPHQRDPRVIYTDIVSQEDKNAIVAFVMAGVKTVEPFREGRPE